MVIFCPALRSVSQSVYSVLQIQIISHATPSLLSVLTLECYNEINSGNEETCLDSRRRTRIGNFLRIQLSLAGYDVTTTTSGAEAIEIVRTKEPDIMLLDVLMPDVTSMEVLEQVRAFSKVPIIVFTGRPEIFEFVRKLGASDYIAKPFNPDLLVEKISLVLGTSRSAKERNASKEENPAR